MTRSAQSHHEHRYPFVAYHPERVPIAEGLARGRTFLQHLDGRLRRKSLADALEFHPPLTDGTQS